jgi:septum formation protein
MQIVLASASPRRAELLQKIGLDFTVQAADVEENFDPSQNLETQLENLALRKAWAVADTLNAGLVIGADTVVVIDGEVLGKPASSKEAALMLSRLSKRKHQVLTGLAVIDVKTGKVISGVESTMVQFRALSPAEITAYVETGEPLDKAGAYGIQEKGATLVERIEGCYFNVVGLPVARMVAMLKEAGLEVHRLWHHPF